MLRLPPASLAVALTTGLLVSGPSAHAEPRTYLVDTEHSQLSVQVFKSGALSALGHDHLFLPERWYGRLQVDPQAPERSHVQLRVEANSLRYHEPGLSDSDRAKVEAQTRDQVLEAARFPTIALDAQRIVLDVPPSAAEGTGALDLHGELDGTLTLHGVTRPLRVPFHATVTEGSVSGTGGVTLSLREFGIKPVSAALGAVSVKDEVQVSFELTARPAAPR
ncbi:MAG: YceI family protein [Myxococcales bacterium]